MSRNFFRDFEHFGSNPVRNTLVVVLVFHCESQNMTPQGILLWACLQNQAISYSIREAQSLLLTSQYCTSCRTASSGANDELHADVSNIVPCWNPSLVLLYIFVSSINIIDADIYLASLTSVILQGVLIHAWAQSNVCMLGDRCAVVKL